MADNMIQVKRLNKVYGTTIQTHVLFDIELEIERNTFTALIGPSGSGKSTLLNCLGLLDPPTSGKIVIDGQSFSDINVNKLASFRNENIGFVFQFHHLLPEFTVFENILMPHWIKSGRPGQDLIEEANRLIDRVGLGDIKNKYVTQISGGQQQRVSIARALINRPKVIFADEPTGNLDRETGAKVLDLLREINRENNTTLVMVTHDREVAIRSDRIIELVDGRICRSIDVRSSSKESAVEMLESRACVLPDSGQT
ncbi:MAG: ABC transporter ATP-binding protein [Desulfatiglans sp.]|nr:ABC transporter ATP-binding protein [Desulfatiglans sp.]